MPRHKAAGGVETARRAAEKPMRAWTPPACARLPRHVLAAWAVWTDVAGAVLGSLVVSLEIVARRRFGAGSLVGKAGVREN